MPKKNAGLAVLSCVLFPFLLFLRLQGDLVRQVFRRRDDGRRRSLLFIIHWWPLAVLGADSPTTI